MRRARVLQDAGVDHIDPYLEKLSGGEALDPIPHLVIVIDEVVGLADGRPGLVGDLVRLVDAGRPLGLHLVVTTHKPAELIADGGRDLFRFRLSLPLDRPDESQDLLGAADAPTLTQPGQSILQDGEGELTTAFQAAWGGAPYRASGFAARDPHEILEVALDGSRQPLRLSTTPLRIEAPATQLESVVAHIIKVAEREAIRPLTDLSLSPLP